MSGFSSSPSLNMVSVTSAVNAVALGIDSSDSNKFKLQVVASGVAVPTGVVQLTIDPSANGNIILTPNGTGFVQASYMIAGAVVTDSSGQMQTAQPGTVGQVLTSNGAGVLPSFQPASGSVLNLNLPNTNAAGTQGIIFYAGDRWVSEYSSSATQTNAFVGRLSGNLTNSGQANNGFGSVTLQGLTSGIGNNAFGVGALRTVSSSNNNSAFGGSALQTLSTGANNVAYGHSALFVLDTGNRNTALGSEALSGISTSNSDNIAVGYQAGINLTNTGSSNIYVGNGGVAAESNTIRIGTQGNSAGQQNVCQIAGIYTASVGATNAAVFIDSNGVLGTSGGTAAIVSWSVITANQAAAVNNGYICNKAGTLALSLPTTSAVGSIIRVTGINTATGWQITQAAGQQIFIGTSSTTLGATGTLTSSAIRDSIEMVCVVANLTWNVISSIGNITVV